MLGSEAPALQMPASPLLPKKPHFDGKAKGRKAPRRGRETKPAHSPFAKLRDLGLSE